MPSEAQWARCLKPSDPDWKHGALCLRLYSVVLHSRNSEKIRGGRDMKQPRNTAFCRERFHFTHQMMSLGWLRQWISDNSLSVNSFKKSNCLPFSLFSAPADLWKNPFFFSLWIKHVQSLRDSPLQHPAPVANKPVLMCLDTCCHQLFWYLRHILFPLY